MLGLRQRRGWHFFSTQALWTSGLGRTTSGTASSSSTSTPARGGYCRQRRARTTAAISNDIRRESKRGIKPTSWSSWLANATRRWKKSSESTSADSRGRFAPCLPVESNAIKKSWRTSGTGEHRTPGLPRCAATKKDKAKKIKDKKKQKGKKEKKKEGKKKKKQKKSAKEGKQYTVDAEDSNKTDKTHKTEDVQHHTTANPSPEEMDAGDPNKTHKTEDVQYHTAASSTPEEVDQGTELDTAQNAATNLGESPPRHRRYLYASIGRGGSMGRATSSTGGARQPRTRAETLAERGSLYNLVPCGQRCSKCEGTCGGTDDDQEEAVQQ